MGNHGNITIHTHDLYEIAAKLDDLANISGVRTSTLVPLIQDLERALIRTSSAIRKQVAAEQRAEASRASH